ncbi:MAG: hypothetical protein WDO74_14825 [Pseudomonadota bacterium]
MVSAALRSSAARLRRHWPSLLFALVALAIWGWVTWDAVYVRMITWEAGSDYWEHSASLHALIQNPWHPRHPHLATDAGGPRFGPQFLLVALIARALHWDAIQAMTLCAVLNTLLFLCAIRVFFRTYFRHPLAPLYGLLVMFGGWWFGFQYSNVYSLPVLFSVASFPSTTALGLTLLGFALAVRLLRGQVHRPWLALLGLGVWAGAVFIIHPLTAMLSLSGVLLLALAEPKASWRLRFELAGAVVIGCALSHFWPYFSPWVVLRGGHGEAAGWAEQTVQQAAAELHVKKRLHEFYNPPRLLKALGLGVITLLALPYFLLRRVRWFVGLGALGMLLPFVGNIFVEVPLGHRFLLLAIVYLHIGLVWLLLRSTPHHAAAFGILRHRAAGIASAIVIAAALSVFCVHSVLVALERFENPRFHSGNESPVLRNMRLIGAAAGPSAVVLASPLLSWQLPTFGPKVLVLHHQDPLVPDAAERTDAVRRFLRSASDDERREILKRYGVSHVLLQRESGSVGAFLAQISTVRAFGAGYRLYTLSPAALSPKP